MADHHPSKRCRGAWIFALLLASAFDHLGCAHPPPGRYAIDKVEGLIKTYDKPFAKDNHNALSASDYIWARFEDNQIMPVKN